MKEILGVLIPVIIIPESMVWFLMVMHLHDHPDMMSEKEVRSRRTLLFACHAIICIGLMMLLWRCRLSDAICRWPPPLARKRRGPRAAA